MIPAIKESNQLKVFLGVREHYPEYYNESMDKIGGLSEKNSVDGYKSLESAKPFQFSSLKEFTITKKETEPDSGTLIISTEPSAYQNPKNDLLKFITGQQNYHQKSHQFSEN